jgi:glycosyltransferase involved in cell wall biosynthesis
MKILYLNPFDGTGYGQAAVHNCRALDSVGVDVVCRRLKYNDSPVDKRIEKLLAKPARGCDIVIQHFLPRDFVYDGHYSQCIGHFALETDRLNTSWTDRCNMMDSIWVINKQMENDCKKSLKVPTKVIPHAADMQRYQQSYPRISEIPSTLFTFYFIGELNRRKNLAALLKAFHLEFDLTEPVQLVLKTNKPGLNPQQCLEATQQYCNEIKKGMKLGSCKEELIITDFLSDTDLLRLHSTCDCFVSPSYGEAWGECSFDAMAMGKTPIYTGWGGFCDYLSEESGYPVAAYAEPAFGMMETLDDLYTSRENWFSVFLFDLRQKMRMAYENKKQRERKAEVGIKRAYDFSYEKVGQLMMEALNA